MANFYIPTEPFFFSRMSTYFNITQCNTYPSSRPLDCYGSCVSDCNNAIKCNCTFLLFGKVLDTIYKEMRYLDSLNPSERDIFVVAHIQ